MWWNASARASGRADFSQPFPPMPPLGLVTHEPDGAAVRLGGLPADIATATARLSSTTATGALGPAAHTERQSAANSVAAAVCASTCTAATTVCSAYWLGGRPRRAARPRLSLRPRRSARDPAHSLDRGHSRPGNAPSAL